MRQLLKGILLFSLFILIYKESEAQWPVLSSMKSLNPSDPSEPYSFISFNGERFNLVNGEIYSWGVTGAWAFDENKHQLQVKIPFVRSSVAGIEDLIGIGDITFRYKGVVHELPEGLHTYKTTTFYFDLSISTGNEFDGHGTGSLVGVPGLIFAFKPIQEVGIYPRIWYIHSFKDVSGEFMGGYPSAISSDPDENNEKMIRNLGLQVMFSIELPSASWMGIAPVYSKELVNRDNIFSISPELGKLFDEHWLIRLNSLFYITGRRRLLNWIGFDLTYYLY